MLIHIPVQTEEIRYDILKPNLPYRSCTDDTEKPWVLFPVPEGMSKDGKIPSWGSLEELLADLVFFVSSVDVVRSLEAWAEKTGNPLPENMDYLRHLSDMEKDLQKTQNAAALAWTS